MWGVGRRRIIRRGGIEGMDLERMVMRAANGNGHFSSWGSSGRRHCRPATQQWNMSETGIGVRTGTDSTHYMASVPKCAISRKRYPSVVHGNCSPPPRSDHRCSLCRCWRGFDARLGASYDCLSSWKQTSPPSAEAHYELTAAEETHVSKTM